MYQLIQSAVCLFFCFGFFWSHHQGRNLHIKTLAWDINCTQIPECISILIAHSMYYILLIHTCRCTPKQCAFLFLCNYLCNYDILLTWHNISLDIRARGSKFKAQSVHSVYFNVLITQISHNKCVTDLNVLSSVVTAPILMSISDMRGSLLSGDICRGESCWGKDQFKFSESRQLHHFYCSVKYWMKMCTWCDIWINGILCDVMWL